MSRKKLTADQKKRIEQIRKRFKDADLGPLRVRGDTRYGCDVVEPFGAWGRYDVIIARGLDGYTAAFIANVPEDIRWLLNVLEEYK